MVAFSFSDLNKAITTFNVVWCLLKHFRVPTLENNNTDENLEKLKMVSSSLGDVRSKGENQKHKISIDFNKKSDFILQC